MADEVIEVRRVVLEVSGLDDITRGVAKTDKAAKDAQRAYAMLGREAGETGADMDRAHRRGLAGLDDLDEQARRVARSMAVLGEQAERMGDRVHRGAQRGAGALAGLRARMASILQWGAAIGVGGGALLATRGVELAAERNSQMLGLESLMGQREAAAEFGRLQAVGRKPGVSTQTALNMSTALQSLKMDADLAREAAEEFGNALALRGRPEQELDRVATALAQIAGKGKVSAEEINQLAEVVPQIRGVLQDVFKTADTEKIQAQLEASGASAEDFIRILVAGFRELSRAQGGLSNALANARIAANEVLISFGSALASPEGIGAIETLTGAIESLNPVAKALGEELVQWLPHLSEWLADTPEHVASVQEWFARLVDTARSVYEHFLLLVDTAQTLWPQGMEVAGASTDLFLDTMQRKIEQAVEWWRRLWEVVSAGGNVLRAYAEGAVNIATEATPWGKVKAVKAMMEDVAAANRALDAAQERFGQPVPERGPDPAKLQRYQAALEAVNGTLDEHRRKWAALDAEDARRATKREQAAKRTAAALGGDGVDASRAKLAEQIGAANEFAKKLEHLRNLAGNTADELARLRESGAADQWERERQAIGGAVHELSAMQRQLEGLHGVQSRAAGGTAQEMWAKLRENIVSTSDAASAALALLSGNVERLTAAYQRLSPAAMAAGAALVPRLQAGMAAAREAGLAGERQRAALDAQAASIIDPQVRAEVARRRAQAERDVDRDARMRREPMTPEQRSVAVLQRWSELVGQIELDTSALERSIRMHETAVDSLTARAKVLKEAGQEAEAAAVRQLAEQEKAAAESAKTQLALQKERFSEDMSGLKRVMDEQQRVYDAHAAGVQRVREEVERLNRAWAEWYAKSPSEQLAQYKKDRQRMGELRYGIANTTGEQRRVWQEQLAALEQAWARAGSGGPLPATVGGYPVIGPDNLPPGVRAGLLYSLEKAAGAMEQAADDQARQGERYRIELDQRDRDKRDRASYQDALTAAVIGNLSLRQDDQVLAQARMHQSVLTAGVQDAGTQLAHDIADIIRRALPETVRRAFQAEQSRLSGGVN